MLKIKTIKEYAGLARTVLAIAALLIAGLLWLISAETSSIRSDVSSLKTDVDEIKQAIGIGAPRVRKADADPAPDAGHVAAVKSEE